MPRWARCIGHQDACKSVASCNMTPLPPFSMIWLSSNLKAGFRVPSFELITSTRIQREPKRIQCESLSAESQCNGRRVPSFCVAPPLSGSGLQTVWVPSLEIMGKFLILMVWLLDFAWEADKVTQPCWSPGSLACKPREQVCLSQFVCPSQTWTDSTDQPWTTSSLHYYCTSHFLSIAAANLVSALPSGAQWCMMVHI